MISENRCGGSIDESSTRRLRTVTILRRLREATTSFSDWREITNFNGKLLKCFCALLKNFVYFGSFLSCLHGKSSIRYRKSGRFTHLSIPLKMLLPILYTNFHWSYNFVTFIIFFLYQTDIIAINTIQGKDIMLCQTY